MSEMSWGNARAGLLEIVDESNHEPSGLIAIARAALAHVESLGSRLAAADEMKALGDSMLQWVSDTDSCGISTEGARAFMDQWGAATAAYAASKGEM